MTNEQLVQLDEGLSVCGNIKDKKIAYAVARNMAKVNSAMKGYRKNLKELQHSHAKIKDGKPVIANNQVAMKDWDKWEEAYLDFQEKQVELKLHKIRYSDIPDVSGNEMAVLLLFTEGNPA